MYTPLSKSSFFLLCWLLTLTGASLCAQPVQPIFQSYTTEDGLGGESINDILIDRYGYVWTAAYSGLHRYDGYDFKSFPADPLDSCALNNRTVLCLLEDETGDIWAGTHGGLHRLDRSTGCFHRYFHVPERKTSLPGNEITDLLLDTDGNVIVQTTFGTARFQRGTDDFIRLSSAGPRGQRLVNHQGVLYTAGSAGLSEPNQPGKSAIPFAGPAPATVHVLRAHGDSLLIGTNTGLYIWNGRDSLLTHAYGEEYNLTTQPVLDLLPATIHGIKGYWVATRGHGLAFIDLASGIGNAYEAGSPKAFSLLDNHVRSLAYDSLGSIWIGTYVGLNRFNLNPDNVVYYRNSNSDGLADQVLEVHADATGAVYLYERWRGLFRSRRLGRNTRKLSLPQNEFLHDKDLNFLLTDRQGTTWFLRGNDALYRYDPATESPVLAHRDTNLTNRRLNGLTQDPHDDDVYWLATSRGLGRLHTPTGRSTWWLPETDHGSLTGNVVSVALATPDGRVWLSAGNYNNDHLGYFDTATQSFYFFNYQPGDPSRIGGGRIKQLALGRDGSIWAAASQGLIGVDPITNRPRLITRAGNEQIGTVESILTDSLGGVWFARDDQIGHYKPETDELRMITCPPIRQFGNAVAAHYPDGKMLFGGMGGLVSVTPYQRLGNANDYPALVLNEIRVNGQVFRSERPAPEIENLELGPRQRSVSLRFSALLFDRTHRVEYAYRLNNEEWQPLGMERSLSFAGLQPGTFRIDLRSTDGQGNWSPVSRSLFISVAPFWHETTVARLAMGAVLLALLGLLVRMLFRHRLERQTLDQMREVDAFKSRFLTNLTHEFRTPLTLILGPARRLRERDDQTVRREARRIDRQGKRLLGLINQLLDLRQLEAGELSVKTEPLILSRFLRTLTMTFTEAAEEKAQALRFEAKMHDAVKTTMPTEADWGVAVDRSKVESIVTNLLANALKFTPKGGIIDVRLEEGLESWSLFVADSGPGVPAADREMIFERFARSGLAEAPGTGIGLTLARELARLLGGELSLGKSLLGGAEFTLKLPRVVVAGRPPDSVSRKIETEVASITPETGAGHGARVLIVEDDPEVRAFLTESLSEHYVVSCAPDGESGLATAFGEVPDLVVSDVMMPGLNGLQLCARLKNDKRTSHLPVLLLTARTAEEHRLSGLDHGADAYLNKPFSERELHLRLRNLLALRDQTARRLREQLLVGEQSDPDPVAGPGAAFLDQLRLIVTTRIDDPELGVADLVRELGLSRSQLHRKLTATLGLSATKVITQMRLEAAARLLNSTDAPVSEIAYDCGFRDAGYFGKKFKERYGVSPGTFRARGR